MIIVCVPVNGCIEVCAWFMRTHSGWLVQLGLHRFTKPANRLKEVLACKLQKTTGFGVVQGACYQYTLRKSLL